MKIIRDLNEIEHPFNNAVVTLGNFDGVHLGHREIFRSVVRRARQCGGTSIVCTFQPHPLKMLSPERAPCLINTASERERLIEASCVDVLLLIPFTAQLAALSPEVFVQDVLIKTIGLKHLVIGYDYAFGKGRSGSVSFLRQQGDKCGFDVEVFDPVQHDGQVLSSTRVRQMVQLGNVAGAVGLLGRQFNLEGVVVHGDNRGHTLGFATANIETHKELLPRCGVYAAIVHHGDDEYHAVVNVGHKPTFGDHLLTIEAHLLNVKLDLYGERLRVYFVQQLRDEQVFDSKEALCCAIEDDIKTAREILEQTEIIEFREYLTFCGGE
ncbi:MAG: bifunctional riboflavin kinase/FAD synthetase [Thermodesulfobacteriota bacterium]|nr:bifunctional riboflavin kinase/FAD synthetase [Thermodesulfobacteriota bacterium]